MCTIDTCYEGVISELSRNGKIAGISQEMLSFTTNHERVLYVHKILKSLNAIPKLCYVKKCEKLSTHYRNLGNEEFKKSNKSIFKVDKYQAWQYYNLSLLYAPLDSENYVLAISNRSAVFFALKRFSECIRDIEKVFSMKYPSHLEEKLRRRKQDCESNLNDLLVDHEHKRTIQELLSLKSPTHETYICASSKLEVECSKEMGRHVVAKEDIKVGEVLAVESPYLTLLLKSQYLFSCYYCLSRSLNLFPCDTCCFVLYCSNDCKENAWKEHHKFDCPLTATLIQMDFTKLELLALRTVIKARTDHHNWYSLIKTIENAEINENTELHGLVNVDGKWIYDSKYYTSIHTLSSNIEKRSVSDIFQKSVTAAVFYHYLDQYTDFLKDAEGEDQEKIRRYVAGMLLHHDMTSPTNMHGLSSNMQNAEGNFVDEVSIASAPYAFHSLINHSCAPNVTRSSKLGSSQLILVALRPIKKGKQIFDNYGYHHALEDRRSRQKGLKFQYKFDCCCEACVGNWPIYFGLKHAKSLPPKIKANKDCLLDKCNIEQLQKGDVSTALDVYQPLCQLAEDLEPYAPCVELADCQESLKQCLAIFEGLVHHGYSKQVPWNIIPAKD